MRNYLIRPSCENDIEFLWDMLYEAIYVPEGEQRPSKEILNKPDVSIVLNEWGRKDDYAFIAVNSDDKRIGAVWMRLFNEENKTFGYINNHTPLLGIAIMPEYRSLGIGTLLLVELLKKAKEFNYSTISLSVDPNNPARRLYERHGFEKVGVDGTSWNMMKTLI